MPQIDFMKVHMAAQILIERHGERALEIARVIEEDSVQPNFAMAVTAEVKRLQEERCH